MQVLAKKWARWQYTRYCDDLCNIHRKFIGKVPASFGEVLKQSMNSLACRHYKNKCGNWNSKHYKGSTW